MSWLPAVRFAGSRSWLPLSRVASDLIAAVLLDQAAINQKLFVEFAAQLSCDPPLAIFAAQSTTRQLVNQSTNTTRQLVNQGPTIRQLVTTAHHHSANEISLDSLAAQFLVCIPTQFASGDAFLGIPSNRERFVPQWEDLHQTFMRMPHSDWVRSANQWFAVTGNQVTNEEIENWPRIVDEPIPIIVRGNERSLYSATHLDLSLMARKLSHAKTREASFSESVQVAKRASLKQFAYGLSHEINNPLANISARAQGLMRDENDSARTKTLQRIVDQSMRAHEMVADLMFYAHPPEPKLVELDLHSILNAVANQTRPTITDRGIELQVIAPESRVTIQADRSMLTEAVRALVRNSIEAIGCDGRIELECTIQTQVPVPSPLYTTEPTALAASLVKSTFLKTGPEASAVGSSAVIVVRDSGPGLSDEACRHAFDPYYSGREAGRGLGVGLCRVERIATLHGGSVSLTSGPAGCVARLVLR